MKFFKCHSQKMKDDKLICLQDKFTDIGPDVFDGFAVENLILANTTLVIRDYAFSGLGKCNIYLPKSIREIEPYAFENIHAETVFYCVPGSFAEKTCLQYDLQVNNDTAKLFELVEQQKKAEEEERERVRREAEEKARREAEEKARQEAEERAKREAEEKARREAEEAERAKREAEEKARREAEEIERAKREAEEQARKAEEAKAKREEAERARKEAENTEDDMAEQARKAEEAKAKREEAERAKKEADNTDDDMAEQARKAEEAKAKREEAERAKKEAENVDDDMAEQARKAEEAIAKREAAEKAKLEAEAKVKTGDAVGQTVPEDSIAIHIFDERKGVSSRIVKAAELPEAVKTKVVNREICMCCKYVDGNEETSFITKDEFLKLSGQNKPKEVAKEQREERKEPVITPSVASDEVFVNCPHCNKLVHDGDKFCIHCGKRIQTNIKCNSCGSINDVSDNFCFCCGAKLN
ncbi:MAG: hypothetical protein E7403_04820 [Ruminococcaceae bacterium]|nr:hypothetical protein [Oscillospiraceae bacterium]